MELTYDIADYDVRDPYRFTVKITRGGGLDVSVQFDAS